MKAGPKLEFQISFAVADGKLKWYEVPQMIGVLSLLRNPGTDWESTLRDRQSTPKKSTGQMP
jgi:hypothetical protein